MLWGCITMDGPRELVWIKGKQNSEKYIETIEEFLINNDDFDRERHIFQ